MDVRPARTDDRTEIGEVARRSFETSYSLSPLEIDTIVERVFSEAALTDRLDDPDALVLVVEDENDDGVVGFAEAELGEGAALRWLHVHPDARGQGIGTALVERVREEFDDRDLPFVARALEAASEGSGFLERFGLGEHGTASLSFDGESFREQVYTMDASEDEANEPSVEVPETVTVGDEEVSLDRDERVPGTEAPFFPVFTDEEHEHRYGFFCSNCGSTDVSADGLDRLACNNCGNEHLADEWDGAYL